MSDFFTQPILNSPYEYPGRHWELDGDRLPTNVIIQERRKAEFITPGITIRDRLRVLQPNDPENYYRTRQLVPQDLLPEIHKAKIVITNYHAFKRRETQDIAKGTRAWLGDSNLGNGRGDDSPGDGRTDGTEKYPSHQR